MLLVVYQTCAAGCLCSMTLFFSPEAILAFFQNELLVFLDNAFLDQFLVFCVAFCGLMAQNLFLGPSLCWTCMCAFTASRSEKLESLSAGGPGWQVLRVSGRQAEGGFLYPC